MLDVVVIERRSVARPEAFLASLERNGWRSIGELVGDAQGGSGERVCGEGGSDTGRFGAGLGGDDLAPGGDEW
jgi:hypothetical protein